MPPQIVLISIHLKLILDMVRRLRVSDLFYTEFSVAEKFNIEKKN